MAQNLELAVQLALQGYDSKKIAKEIDYRNSSEYHPPKGDPLESELIDTLTLEQLYDIGSAMKHEEELYQQLEDERSKEELIYPY